MDDVGSIHSENENLRIIRGRLYTWEAKDNPLAPLTSKQQESIEILTQKWQELYEETPSNIVDIGMSRSDLKRDINEVTCKSLQELPAIVRGIEKTNDFLDWYDKVNAEIHDHADGVYHKYLEQLEVRSDECQNILQEIDLAMCKLNELNTEYNFVSNKTSSLNSASESLIQEQEKLNEINKQIQIRLHYFNQVEYLSQRLQSPTLSVLSDAFRDCLNRIDECLQYLRLNVKFKDSSVFIVKYKYCHSKAIGLMKNYVTQVMSQATENVLGPKQAATVTDNANSDTAFALYYGKFQTSAIKVKRVSQMIEERIGESYEYEQLLSYIHQHYLSERATIMSPAVDKAIKDLKTNNKSDHCTMMRSACAFLVHICQDEHRLFFQFFSVLSEQLNVYLEGLCTILYDTMRPYIIHINHLETLAEICSILRIEMLEEHVQQNPEPLESFAKIALQLLQDVQERLVFRANLYLQSDILNYNPSSGDLAYPEKLEMMESIALSLQEPQMRRSNSRNSMISNISSVGQENDFSDSHSMTMRNFNSPADLHGMWYPTVRRTLVCLSRLYRCVDRPIFQGLSQEALQYCIQSVSAAANKISAAKTPIDGELFEIKHLLILREQIAPFRVDFTIRETTLDFSKVKTAAYGLLQKRKQIFSMGSNNSLLEFLLEGTPQVKEHLLDSRKDVDRHLKMVCESFIKNAVQMLVGPILNFLDKAQNVLADSSQTGKNRSESKAPTKINYNLRQSQWASPQQISGIIQESLRLIKSKLSTLQRSMQLYLSNRDTKSIIFRPIRLNIISAFVRLEQILTMNGYSQDDMTITSCPSSDYVSMLLLGVSEGVTVSGRKMSTSSTEGGPMTTRKTSVIEKKVSFDNSVLSVREENPEVVNDSEAINPSSESEKP